MANEQNETTKFEKEYIDKITAIWRKKDLPILKKIKQSDVVIDSVDKIKWPKGIPVILKEIAINSLKITLLKTEHKAMLTEYGDGEVLDSNKILEEICIGMRRKWWQFWKYL
ncbi:MAG: hypothetical protein WA063_06660 [Minisyncoccia bacterium]